jgi:hypothetical protein
MLDISAMENFLDDGTAGSDEDSPPVDITLENFNSNGDKELNCEDCPFDSDTFFARRWFDKVMMPWTESQVTPELKEQYGDNLTGMYQGRPLIPGSLGTPDAPQGDFQLLVDKLKLTQGFDQESADRIASSVMRKLYG